MNHLDTNKITFWGLLFLLLIFFESAFLGNGNIVFFLLGVGLLVYGMRKRSKSIFITGLVFFIIALLGLWSLRLLILAIVVYVLLNLWKGVPSEEILRPLQEFKRETPNGIWKNKLFSVQTSPFSSYEWEDVHIQGFFGDLHIDVTETVLPKTTSLISVRQGIGKIKIEVPYDIPVRIHYTTFLGEIKLFGLERKRLINESLHMKDGYEYRSDDKAELIITLSTWFGDVEVTRK